MKARVAVLATCALLAVSSVPASATFHIMQIERVIGGVDGEIPAGRSAFSWDPRAASLRSGVYTLAVEADGARVLRRFVFVRDAHAPTPYIGPHPD